MANNTKPQKPKNSKNEIVHQPLSKKIRSGKPIKVDDPRNYTIRKVSELIQEGRFNLDKNEFKALGYIVSLIKKDDKENTVYTFDCRKFLNSIGYRSDCNLAEARGIIKSLASQKWWIQDQETGNWKLAGWINLAQTDADSKNMSITFHETVAPYIFNLDEQGKYITRYKYGYINQMQKEYSPRLYELLKSYSNNSEWIFEFNTDSDKDLRVILAKMEENVKTHKRVVYIPKYWSKYSIFKRDVLEPAKEEINRFTDLRIDYEPLKVDLQGNKHRGTAAIRFSIEQVKVNFTDEANVVSEQQIVEEPTQLSFFDAYPDFREEEQQRQIDEYNRMREEAIDNSAYPCTTDLLYGFVTETQVVALVESLAERVVPGRIPKKNLDAWACDVIGHYWRKISATPDRTKSTPFLRLMSDLNYDNDGVISKQTQWESKN